MHDGPLVTIVTPSFNQGRFIRATIESVLSQDYPHIEYIIMDGGSTDETAAVAAEYAGRLTFISEKDRGQSHAINKGFQRARGTIVAWLNSDDAYVAGAVRRAVEAMGQYPEAGAIYGEGYLMNEDGHVTCRFPHTQQFDLWRLIHLSDYILQQTVFFRRDVLERIDWLREDLHYAMDWDLLIRIGRQFSLQYVPAYLGCLREYSTAKSFAGGPRRIREIASVLRQHSGRRWPAGVLLYGLDTYLTMARERIGGWAPPLPAGVTDRLQLWATSAVQFFLGFVFEAPRQGWHSDGFCEPYVRHDLPVAGGMLVLEGEVPATAWLRGQSLDVTLSGVSLGRFPVDGRFRIAVPVERPQPDVQCSLEVRATLHIIPGNEAPFVNGMDFRRISYVLDRIVWDGYEFLPSGKFRTVSNGIPTLA
jgi:hypothetical protein